VVIILVVSAVDGFLSCRFLFFVTWAAPAATFINGLGFALRMVVIQRRSQRKASGGRYKSTLSKRTHMLGRSPSMTRIGELRKRTISTKGGNGKERLFETNTANLYSVKTKKHESATIKGVAENPANRNFVRRNILTRGTIIETSKGKARVTSRPGQDGVVNAVLIE
jgi:small subunit ribosomal protein S8e